MTAERRSRILRIYHSALALESEGRTLLLDAECAGDDELRVEVESLLADQPPETFLAASGLKPASTLTSEEPADPLCGRQIAAYRILSRLGAGGMGVVYKALDTRLDRHVALKFVPLDLTRDDAVRQRFIREAKAASILDHPNICTVHEIGNTPDGQLFMAMAFYQGQTLRNRIECGPLPVDEALDVAIQVARGLASAHAAGVVHRDIKPANLVVTTAGVVKIVDFGIAKRPGGTILTQTGLISGTVGYMAPEVIAGADADAQSDVWALGAVLYEMIAGRKAFLGDDQWAVMHAIREGVVDSPSAIRPDLSADVERLVLRALERSRDARFRSAAEFLKEAERCQSVLTHGELRPEVLPARRQPRVRQRIAIAGLAAAAVLSAGAFWFSSRNAGLRWAERAAIPKIEEYVEAAEWEAAYALAKEARSAAPDAASLAELWPRLSWLTTIRSDPPGARVFRRAYSATSGAWEDMGTTPLEKIRFPFGLSRIRLELEGHRPLLRTLGGGTFTPPELPLGRAALGELNIRPEVFKLDTLESLPSDKVRVSGATASVLGTPVEFGDFFLGRYEVTNQEYRKFVQAGGYQQRALWEHPFVRDGRTISWEAAMALFTDKTGRPGPSTWEVGDYPEGWEDYPVGGVSWYEAAAYARFVGEELPTVHHWRRAYAPGSLTWMVPASNLDTSGPAPVGRFPGISWPGTYDMSGNVREWCFNALGDRQVILGGGWNDSPYLAQQWNEPPGASPFDRSATNGFRLAIVDDEADVATRMRLPLPEGSPTRALAQEPISDEVFAAYRRMYAYDQAPLAATIDATVARSHWTRHRVSFAAAYGGERMVLYLFLPQTGTPPFQTVLYWPASIVTDLPSIDDFSTYSLDFILKSGRAVAIPVFKNTFERRIPGRQALEPRSRARSDLNVQQLSDLRRSIDYLESRPDIDRGALAFYGYSWGGEKGPVVLAIEPRLRAGILVSGGIWPVRYLPEVDSATYIPRVKAPVLVLSGEFDTIYPAETNVKPFFQQLGTAARDKRHVVAPGGHFVPRAVLVRETLDWLDKYLGPPR